MLAIPVSRFTPPFSLFFFTTQHSCWTSLHNILGFPGPFYSLGHPQPISFFPSFLHSHGLLLISLGSPDPIATSFSFGFIGLQTNPIFQFFSLGSSAPFFAFFLFLMIPMGLLLHSLELPWPVCFLWSHFVILWACGPLFLTFRLNGLYFAIFFLHSFFILLGFFCHWALLPKMGINKNQ